MWDEAAMTKMFAIESIDRTLKNIMSNSKPFGGKLIVFKGDFSRAFLVLPWVTILQIINHSLVKSYLWQKNGDT